MRLTGSHRGKLIRRPWCMLCNTAATVCNTAGYASVSSLMRWGSQLTVTVTVTVTVRDNLRVTENIYIPVTEKPFPPQCPDYSIVRRPYLLLKSSKLGHVSDLWPHEARTRVTHISGQDTVLRSQLQVESQGIRKTACKVFATQLGIRKTRSACSLSWGSKQVDLIVWILELTLWYLINYPWPWSWQCFLQSQLESQGIRKTAFNGL
jgi:hypothetical protein